MGALQDEGPAEEDEGIEGPPGVGGADVEAEDEVGCPPLEAALVVYEVGASAPMAPAVPAPGAEPPEEGHEGDAEVAAPAPVPLEEGHEGDPEVAAPAPPPAPVLFAPKAYREHAVEVPGGRLAWDPHKGCMEATCTTHAKCQMTRTVKARRWVEGVPFGGRPIGFLTAWLHMGVGASRDAHWNKEEWKRVLTWEKRCDARRFAIGACDIATATVFCEKERELEPAVEHEEPRDLVGLL